MKKTIMILCTMLSLTCVAQTKKDTATYFMTGKLPSFDLLYKAIANPDDVTTNQKKSLLIWIERGLMSIPDSVTSKKKKP